MKTPVKFGLLLPHFGACASIDKCLQGAQRAEAYGFDSLWARDHLVFKPHEIEGRDNTHIESLTLLSAVASITERVSVGTAMAICHRHPIHLAQCFASLSAISNGRVILGMGLGGFAHEFAAAGRPTALPARAKLAKTNVAICRRLWNGETVSFTDDAFRFENVALKPAPKQRIPVWIGGGTAAACRRAAEYGDGWLPARITLATFSKRFAYLRELCRDAARPMIETAVMPLTTIGRDLSTAVRGIDLNTIVEESQRFTSWVTNDWENVDSSRGLILAGTPADIVRECRAYQEAGASHIVFDLRLRFGEWYEQLDLLGKEVLPALGRK
ncbi:MAG: LLM class flavin-dependent oxidoreductase [Candidatus Binatia bacterium]